METKMYECESCKKTFNRCERLENHMKKGCDRTTCKTCNKKFLRATDVQQHERTHIRASQKECTTCGKTFNRARHLQIHRENADPIDCDLCDTSFCHRSELERHKRTTHAGQGIAEKEYAEELKQPIFLQTGYEETEGYQEEMAMHMNKIRDSRDEKKFYIFLNKEITPAFTYEDLQNLIYETAMDRGTAFKINLGFGFILYHLIDKEFKYFYVSSNTLLFDVAFTISKRSDVNKLMEKIIDLDLTISYYMKRPSSGWMLAGLPNVEIKIFYLNKVLG